MCRFPRGIAPSLLHRRRTSFDKDGADSNQSTPRPGRKPPLVLSSSFPSPTLIALYCRSARGHGMLSAISNKLCVAFFSSGVLSDANSEPGGVQLQGEDYVGRVYRLRAGFLSGGRPKHGGRTGDLRRAHVHSRRPVLFALRDRGRTHLWLGSRAGLPRTRRYALSLYEVQYGGNYRRIGNEEGETRRQGDKETGRRKFLVPLSPLPLVPLSQF